MNLDQIDFDFWKQSDITQLIFAKLRVLDDLLQQKMLNPNMVLSVDHDGRISYARAAGSRDVIREILNLEFEDLEIEEEKVNNGNEEKSETLF